MKSPSSTIVLYQADRRMCNYVKPGMTYMYNVLGVDCILLKCQDSYSYVIDTVHRQSAGSATNWQRYSVVQYNCTPVVLCGRKFEVQYHVVDVPVLDVQLYPESTCIHTSTSIVHYEENKACLIAIYDMHLSTGLLPSSRQDHMTGVLALLLGYLYWTTIVLEYTAVLKYYGRT
jgi:hypothetical protein